MRRFLRPILFVVVLLSALVTSAPIGHANVAMGLAPGAAELAAKQAPVDYASLFNGTCLSCGIATGLYSTLVKLAEGVWIFAGRDPFILLVVGLVVYLVWLGGALVSPGTSIERAVALRGEFISVILKVFVAAGVLGSVQLAGALGFRIIWTAVFEFILTFALLPAVKVLQLLIVNSGIAHASSIFAQVSQTCGAIKDTPTTFACILHANEAGLGWAVRAVLTVFNTWDPLEFNFWISIYLLFQITSPIIRAPLTLIKNFISVAIGAALLKYVLVAWVFPVSKGSMRAVLASAIHAAITILLTSTLIVAMIATTAFVLYQQLPADSTGGAYSGDAFSGIAIALAKDKNSLFPNQPIFWIIMLIGSLYSDLLTKVEAEAQYWTHAFMPTTGS